MTAVKISVAACPATIDTCELCATPAVQLAGAVLVSHTDGGAVQLAACGQCVKAVRRLVAAIGRDATRIAGEADRAVPVELPEAPPVLQSAPELVQEYLQRLVAADTEFVARAYGQERTDGTWIGWLEFVALGRADQRRTEMETTQPDRAALAYWASGLEPRYLEGAFARARRLRQAA